MTASKKLYLPPAQVCPLCGHDDNVKVSELSGADTWTFRCSTGRHHHEPHDWEVAHETPSGAHEGICAELGLYEDLPGCVPTSGGSHEHGIVEYLYQQAHRQTYLDLVSRYGHVKVAPKRYTASVILARTLGQLSREGIVAYRPRLPATGFWSYNGTVGYWAPTGTPLDAGYITWAAWSAAHDLDPTDWPLQ